MRFATLAPSQAHSLRNTAWRWCCGAAGKMVLRNCVRDVAKGSAAGANLRRFRALGVQKFADEKRGKRFGACRSSLIVDALKNDWHAVCVSSSPHPHPHHSASLRLKGPPALLSRTLLRVTGSPACPHPHLPPRARAALHLHPTTPSSSSHPRQARAVPTLVSCARIQQASKQTVLETSSLLLRIKCRGAEKKKKEEKRETERENSKRVAPSASSATRSSSTIAEPKLDSTNDTFTTT